MENYIAAIMGFMTFLLVWNRTIRWIHLIWVTIKEQRISNSKVPLPVVLFIHSGPWFLVLYIFLAIHILSTPHRPEWGWFFGGALLVPPFIALMVFRAWVHSRTKRNGSSRFLTFAVDHRTTLIGLLWACYYIPFMIGGLFFMQGVSYPWLFFGTPIFAALMAGITWYMWIWPDVSYYLYMKEKMEREQSVSQP